MLLLGLLCCCAASLMVEGQMGPMRSRPRWPSSNRQRPMPQNTMYMSNANRARLSRQQMMAAQERAGARAGARAAGGRARARGGAQAELDPSPPQDWRDLVQMNGGVHSVDDFISLLVTADGRQVNDSDVFSPYETEDGKRVITGGGVMAMSDECSPRNMSVLLPLDFSDFEVAYYPECTKVERCGGCTPTTFLSCEPRYKEKIVLKVLRARYLYPGSLSMRWEGFTSVEVERHLSCRAVCNLQPGDCLQGQRYNRYQCKCTCMRYENCFNGKSWDPVACRCRCSNEGPCCAEDGEEDDRTCTSYFDNDFCECTLKTSIGFSPNASRAEIDAWMESRRGENNENNPFPPFTDSFEPPTTTTTTTTTTTPEPAGPEDCSRRSCPRNFVGISNGRGGCACVFRRLGRRRG